MDDSPPAIAPTSSTSQSSATVDPELLVAQYGWVRSVAQHLVRDRTRAEDVTQETVLAALAAPPRDAADGARLRAWLGRVAFNLSKLGARQGMRRRAREERVARSEALPSASDEVESMATLRELGAAVAGLPAPYREAVQLRYFEGLSTAEIARRAGTSELAVRKRLWRARGKLRDVLEEPGERRSRAAWLAPFGAPWRGALEWLRAGPVPFPRVPLLGGLVGAAAALALSVVGAAWWSAKDTPTARRGTYAARATEARVSRPGPTSSSPARSPSSEAEAGRRRALAPAPGTTPVPEGPHPVQPSGPLPVLSSVTGQVLDLSGSACAGLALVASDRPDEVLVRSDVSGGFRLDRSRLPRLLEARGAGWTTIVPARLEGALPGAEPLVVVSESAPLVGQVVDPAGLALADVQLEVHCTDWAFAAIDRSVHLDSPVLRGATTALDGGFAWSDLPRGAGLFLRARAAGYLEREIPTTELHETLLLELQPESDFLTGVVWRRDGAPAAGARVRLGLGTAFTDLRGRFRLPLRGVQADSWLEASEPGVEPVRHPGFGRHVLAGLRDGVALTLGVAHEICEGVLIEPDKGQRAGWRVLAYAAESAQDSREAAAAQAVTDSDGRFRLSLVPGRYSLVAIGAEAGAVVVEDGLETRSAPWALEVAPPGGMLQGGVLQFGQVLLEGEPVSGARLDVALVIDVLGLPRRVEWRAVDSDAGGRWAFHGPSHSAFQARIDLPGAGPRSVSFESGAGPVQLDLARSATLRVAAAPADSLVVLDESGDPLALRAPGGTRWHVQLDGGRSPVLEVPVEARWLELSGAAGERRLPLALEPGGRTEVRIR